MQTDSEIFADWLNGTTTVAGTRSRKRDAKPIKHGLLVEQYDGSPSITDGKRRGFNGRPARTSASEITGECVVTTALGDRYTLRHYRNHKPGTIDIDALNRLQAKQAHKVNAADLPAIGNVD